MATDQATANHGKKAEARKAKKMRSKKLKKEQADDELEFLEDCINQTKEEQRAGLDKLQSWINGLKSKHPEKAQFGMQLVYFNDLQFMLDTKNTLLERLEILKTEFPALFIAYCEHFSYWEQLAAYTEECMAEKSKQTLKYFHGGFLREL